MLNNLSEVMEQRKMVGIQCWCVPLPNYLFLNITFIWSICLWVTWEKETKESLLEQPLIEGYMDWGPIFSDDVDLGQTRLGAL